MTTWSPGDGGPEVLSSGDRGTSRLATAPVVVRMLLSLALGVFLGAHFFGGEVAAREARNVDAPRQVGCVAGRTTACPPGRPALAGDLTGTWLRTGVRGVWKGLEGREMLRFDTDGGFAWSPAGPYRTVHGRYLLAGGTLTVAVAGTSLCPPGDAYAWRATVTRTGRLHLTPPTGMLPDGCLRASATWSGRRLGAGSGE